LWSDVYVELRAGGDWLVAHHPNPEIAVIPILPDGREDNLRQPCILTQFGERPSWPIWTEASPDGTAVVFTDWARPVGGPTFGDTYILTGLDTIMNAPKLEGTNISSLAPNSLLDPRIIDVRAADTPNCTVMPHFTQDGKTVIYAEEWNNVFDADRFFETMTLSNWDIMVSDAAPGGEDFRLDRPLNQACAVSTPGGTKVIYLRQVEDRYHLFITTLKTATTLPATQTGDPGDNSIVTTATVSATDTASTQMTVPVGTVVDFPAGAPQEILITTPIPPVATAQLPPDIQAIPVVREFGPPGTTFSQPVLVTIAYTN
jgi:hypothetical protein